MPAADEAQSGDAVAAMIAAIADPSLWFDADADFMKDSARAARRIEATRAEAVALGQLAAQVECSVHGLDTSNFAGQTMAAIVTMIFILWSRPLQKYKYGFY